MNSSSSQKLLGLRAYIKFCKPYRKKILFTLCVFTVSNILLAVVPVFIGRLVETVTSDRSNTTLIWTYIGILIGCSSLHDILWRGAEFSYRGFLNEISYYYETFLFKAVIRKPYPFFVDKLTGKIGSYITTISSEFKLFLDQMLFDFSGQIVNIVATILIMSTLNWQSTVVYVLGLALMFFIGRFTLAYNMRYEAIAADVGSSKNGILYDSIANFSSIKALRTELQELHTIELEQDKTLRANQKAFLTGIIFWGSMSVVVRHIMWTSLLILNAALFIDGKMSIGGLATLLSTILIFSTTIWESVWHIFQFGQRMAKVDEAHRYLFGDETNLNAHNKDTTSNIVFKKELRINNLSFAYPDKADVAVLKDVSLTIKQGEKIGVVGKSGSGKSTLTKLLLDYYPTKNGEILVDDINASSKQIAELIAFVPQDTALFHRSIADNISYGADQNVTQKDIEHAAKLAEAHGFITKLPEGYKTLIGERGVKLSGGQRQRIAIARAILRDSPLLVLDEATSALDSESEVLIQTALWKLMEHRTAIVIAHRLSTIQKMDRIVVFDEGKIVEEGSHKQLLSQKGIYAKLWAHQSGGFLEE